MMTGTGSVTGNSQFCLGEWGMGPSSICPGWDEYSGASIGSLRSKRKREGAKKRGMGGGGGGGGKEKQERGDWGTPSFPVPSIPLFGLLPTFCTKRSHLPAQCS